MRPRVDHPASVEASARLRRIRAASRAPVVAGFGIRDAATAKAISVTADAVVVGSRLVQEIEAATEQTAKERLTGLVAELKAAIL